MGIFKLLIEVVIFYFLYQFVVKFVIPIYRTSKRVKKQMREMQSRMNQKVKEQEENYYNSSRPSEGDKKYASSKKETYKNKGEYIDYEDVD